MYFTGTSMRVRVRRELDVRALQADGELAGGMRGLRPLVDVRDRFAPPVEELHGVVATGDLGNRHERATVLVDGDPRFGVRDIEVGVRPVHRAGLAVDHRVPLPTFGEVGLLLAQHEQAAEQVDPGVADVLLGVRGFRLRRRRSRWPVDAAAGVASVEERLQAAGTNASANRHDIQTMRFMAHSFIARARLSAASTIHRGPRCRANRCGCTARMDCPSAKAASWRAALHRSADRVARRASTAPSASAARSLFFVPNE